MLVQVHSVVDIVKFQLVRAATTVTHICQMQKLQFYLGQSNACASFPCYNNGSCTPAGASFLCTCKSPFSGKQCEVTTYGKDFASNVNRELSFFD